MERFGIALKRARVARKMTQAQLGELSGIGRTHVNRIETGETYRPTDETIDKLAAALDMTTDRYVSQTGAAMRGDALGTGPRVGTGCTYEQYADCAYWCLTYCYDDGNMRT